MEGLHFPHLDNNREGRKMENFHFSHLNTNNRKGRELEGGGGKLEGRHPSHLLQNKSF